MKSFPVLSSIAAAALLLTALPASAQLFPRLPIDFPGYSETRIVIGAPRLVPGAVPTEGWVDHQVSFRGLLLVRDGDFVEEFRGSRRRVRLNQTAVRFSNRYVLRMMLVDPAAGLDGSIRGWSLRWRVPARGMSMNDGFLVAVKQGRPAQPVPAMLAQLTIDPPHELQGVMVDEPATGEIFSLAGRGRRQVDFFMSAGTTWMESSGVGAYERALVFRQIGPDRVPWEVLRRLRVTCVYYRR